MVTVYYKERLLPTPWLYIILLLILPAVGLLFMPLNITLGLVLGPVIYVLVVAFLILTSPRVAVEDEEFIAGRANIPARFIGEVETLNSDELTLAIGIHGDARAYLLIRGWIHQAVKVHNTDPTDPAPFWIVTTRTPEELRKALEAAKARAKG